MFTKNEKRTCIIRKACEIFSLYFMAELRECIVLFCHGIFHKQSSSVIDGPRLSFILRADMCLMCVRGSCVALPSMVCHFVVFMPERRFAMKINGLKLTDEALDNLRTLQEDNNSTINGLQEGIYEIEELVLNPEADASYGDRLVMMQTLRDIRHLFELLRVIPGHKY
jgi:hypothetical protein